MNRLNQLYVYAKWWLEATEQLGREIGAPRPFGIYVDFQLDVAIAESIRKPPSRQMEPEFLEDTKCIGSAEFFAALFDEEAST